ncbi:UDP-2,4-diacetamido-2,4,6-trideoxy-beta-L-altropyranose hydrolase [Acidobacteriota bacterium]
MTPGIGSLVLRADGGPTIGAGHVMRCLALAEAWHDAGGSAVLVHREIPSLLAERFTREGVECIRGRSDRGSPEDASDLARVAAKLGATVVLDGYAFGPAYQRELHHNVRTLLVVDDHGQASEYHADFILDQNLGAAADAYLRRPADCRLLLGPSFALLRRDFRQLDRGNPKVRRTAKNILVSFGGSDRGGETSKVLRALKSMDGLDLVVRVAVSAGDPNRRELDRIAGRVHWIRLEHAVENMTDLMTWADIAVTAGGSICWELAFMGIPALLIAIADNQEPIARRLDREGAAINLGRSDQIDRADVSTALASMIGDSTLRRAMSRRGRALVDGGGAARVVRALAR